MFERTGRAVPVRRCVVGDTHRRTGSTAPTHVGLGLDENGKLVEGLVREQIHST